MFPWAEIGKFLSGAVAVVSAGWAVWKYYHKRPRLKVDVDWEWGDEVGDFPRVNILNVGGSTIYIEAIALVEANGASSTIGEFNNLEIKPNQRIPHRYAWKDPYSDDPFDDDDAPRFFYGWEGMKVSVRDTLGREWFSESPPKKEPRWFELSKPEVNDDWLDDMPPQGALT